MNANADKQDTNKDRRRAELGKIHIGKKQLFEDDGAYRDMLEAVAGVRSAADLDEAGRRKVLEHMRACGAQFRPARDKAAERPVAPPETARLVWKIRSLLGDRPEKYAEEIFRRQCGHPHRTPLSWASARQLRGVVAALEYDRKRREKRAAGPAS